ncbi:MAG TPA: iron ABC transporter permease [Alphaproteobacteria bacterium]|nr:iron ABC transporter permease [Alphaproteobacteria bacterium]
MSARAELSPAALYGALALLLALCFAASLAAGPAEIPTAQVFGNLFALDRSAAALVVQEIRLPRTLLGALIGATLGLAGAALQGLLRNPLAEPGLIGVSGGAAFGAVVMFYSGVAAAFPLALPLGGMAGALLAATALYALAGRDSGILTLILAGIAINSLASALTALALNLAPSQFAALEIAFWLLGSVADRTWQHIVLALPFMAAGWLLLLSTGRALDALTLGEETAASLGFDLRSVQLRLILGITLAVGAAVAVSGGIAFVGLVVPHLLRPLVGHQPSRLLPASAFGGASLLLASDIVVRLFPAGPELKLGVVTALIGAPFFLFLVLRTRRAVP